MGIPAISDHAHQCGLAYIIAAEMQAATDAAIAMVFTKRSERVGVKATGITRLP